MIHFGNYLYVLINICARQISECLLPFQVYNRKGLYPRRIVEYSFGNGCTSLGCHVLPWLRIMLQTYTYTLNWKFLDLTNVLEIITNINSKIVWCMVAGRGCFRLSYGLSYAMGDNGLGFLWTMTRSLALHTVSFNFIATRILIYIIYMWIEVQCLLDPASNTFS